MINRKTNHASHITKQKFIHYFLFKASGFRLVLPATEQQGPLPSSYAEIVPCAILKESMEIKNQMNSYTLIIRKQKEKLRKQFHSP